MTCVTRRHLRAATVAAAALLLPQIAFSASGMPNTERITLAIPTDLRSTNPDVQPDGTADLILHHVVEGLVGHREDLSIGPVLAESFKQSEDGLSWQFKLRPGVRFHNGEAMTSADVAWSWNRYLKPETTWQCKRFFDGSQGAAITSIETPAPDVVVFRLEKPNALLPMMMANIQCNAAVLHPSSVAGDGSWTAPVGTGPYVIGDWKPGRYVALTRFDDYTGRDTPTDGMTGARPALAKHLRFLITPDGAVMKNALYAGDLDMVVDLGPADIAEAEQRGLVVFKQPILSWRLLLMQTTDPVLSDKRIRQAIAHAIDVPSIVAVASEGLGKANPSGVALASPYHTAVHDQWPAYDPAAAQALLKEAGYAGQPIRIQTNMRPGGYHEVAITAQAMLQAVGINAQIEVLDWATQLQNYLTGNYQIQSFAYSSRLDPAIAYSSIIGDKAKSPSVSWEDPTAMKLLDASKQTMDPAPRTKLFEQIHTRMADAVPVIGLYNDVRVVATAADLQGYKPWSAGFDRFWGVTKAE
ncbi:peptide ABC transporter substrate-binding protein [Tistrella bauzanensis]|uniref:Peptide ABC transporter substrate-binding protein n=1 Tax=Tistrella bauzanensis TaxID=657419 RepID=A0ABQ1IE66_9PROT|nr:ABC transporter substrate-binding protein [Tistrella bauzanensis]GGB37083.1 peptide ABC transporter substrate-binding protein [Tistrella bauzanensis]